MRCKNCNHGLEAEEDEDLGRVTYLHKKFFGLIIKKECHCGCRKPFPDDE